VFSAVNRASQVQWVLRSLPLNFFPINTFVPGQRHHSSTWCYLLFDDHGRTPEYAAGFWTTQTPKTEKGPLTDAKGSSPSFSPNQFAVHSDSESDTEKNRATSKPPVRTPRIPPIEMYSLLDNHSSNLKQVNNKLTSLSAWNQKENVFFCTATPLRITTLFFPKSNHPNWPTTPTHYQEPYNPAATERHPIQRPGRGRSCRREHPQHTGSTESLNSLNYTGSHTLS